MWQKYIDGQYRQPSGVVGRWVGSKMAQQHAAENAWTVRLLDVQPSDRILEIGFGPGIAIEAAARKATRGLVAGVDLSRTMVAAASKRNIVAVRAGKVELKHADAAHIPYPDESFNKAFSIHSIYFWRDPLAALKDIYRVLKPNGLLILTILPRDKWGQVDPESPDTKETRPYSGDELVTLLEQAGYGSPRIEADADPNAPSNYSVIGKKVGGR